MEYIIEFDVNKNNANIEFGGKDISGKYKQSPNGVYYMICDTLYSETKGSYICKEYIFVFTEKEVVYNKEMPNDASSDCFFVYDDGSCLVATDEYILLLDSDGKQVTKKNVSVNKQGCCESVFWCIGENGNGNSVLFFYDEKNKKSVSKTIANMDIEQNGMIGSVFWGSGTNDDGNTVLLIYNFENAKSIIKIIPDIEYDDDEKEDLLSSEVEMLFTGEKFVFVYDNLIDCLAYDLTGKNVIATDFEIAQVNRKRIEQEQKKHYERIQRIKSQYKYWSERFVKEKAARNKEGVERARSEIENQKKKLLELGVEVPEEVTNVESVLTPEKKSGLFSRLFKK